jgi:indole-3-acetate monooxygenase
MGDSLTQRMIDSARSLQPIADTFRGQIDRERKLPPELIAPMRSAQLLSLWLPTEYGGPDLNLIESVEIIEALARTNGAVGWCACTAAINNRLAGFLSPTVATQIFAAGQQRVAGACMPNGDPRLNQDGTTTPLVTFFPTDRCEIIDTWDVGGLRGSGSHDYQIDNQFVPAEHTIPDQGGDPICAGILYRYPYYTAQGTAIAPVLLGLAQAALDRYVHITSTRTPRMTGTIARDDPTTQETVGRAAAALRAASSLSERTGQTVRAFVPLPC